MPRESAENLSWRPLRSSDARTFAELFTAVDLADHTGERLTDEDAAEYLAEPTVDLALDTFGAFDGDMLVGYVGASVRPLAEVEHRVFLDGVVHPGYRRRGLGTRLLREGVERAKAAHLRIHPGLKLTIDVQKADNMAGALALYEAQGFRPVRYYQHMRHPLGAAIADAPVPEGLRFEPWSEDNDAEFLLIRNDSFRDHWGTAPTSPEVWKSRVTSQNFRPSLSFLLRDQTSGAAAGMAFLMSWDADTAASGVRDAHLLIIGTLREYRRRGVAGALISHALRAAEAEGYDRASLDVDAANPTGAFGVYERAGFAAADRHIRYTLEA